MQLRQYLKSLKLCFLILKMIELHTKRFMFQTNRSQLLLSSIFCNRKQSSKPNLWCRLHIRWSGVVDSRNPEFRFRFALSQPPRVRYLCFENLMRINLNQFNRTPILVSFCIYERMKPCLSVEHFYCWCLDKLARTGYQGWFCDDKISIERFSLTERFDPLFERFLKPILMVLPVSVYVRDDHSRFSYGRFDFPKCTLCNIRTKTNKKYVSC